MFEVKSRIIDKKMEVELIGQLDTGAASKLDAEIRPHLEIVHEIVFDASKLVYISSNGLRILLSARKAMDLVGGSMKVINTPGPVRSIFDVTGFSEILDIE